MILGQVIADLVHVRHQKQADGAEIFVADPAREGIANAELGRLGSEPLVAPEARLGRAVQPFEMMLIDAVDDYFHYGTPGLGAALRPWRMPDWSGAREWVSTMCSCRRSPEMTTSGNWQPLVREES